MKLLPLSVISNSNWYLEKVIESFLKIISSPLSLIMTSTLSLFECIRHSKSVSLEDIKLIANVNWVFNVSGFLRLFIISFKYGGIYSVKIFPWILSYFYHLYFHTQYNCWYKNHQSWLVCNSFLLHFLIQKKL